MAAKRNGAEWPINIIGHDVKPASWFLANERNVRIHPRAQSDATRASLNELGWLKAVLVNIRTSESWSPQDRHVQTLVDGHDRIKIALARGDDVLVPIDYVDLTPTAEAKALVLLDEIAALAAYDREKLQTLLPDVMPGEAALQEVLARLIEREGLLPASVDFAAIVGESPTKGLKQFAVMLTPEQYADVSAAVDAAVERGAGVHPENPHKLGNALWSLLLPLSAREECAP